MMSPNHKIHKPAGIEAQHGSVLISSDLSHGLVPHLIVVLALVEL